MKTFLYLILISLIVACSDLDTAQKEFLDRGEQVYLGKPVYVQIGQGYEKLQLKWISNPSPLIKKTVIYWNNRVDSLVKETESGSKMIIDSVSISNLSEGSIEFEIINRGDGLSSLPVSVLAVVLGKNFVTTLIPRSFDYAVNDELTEVSITWNSAAKTSVYSVLTYTSDTGEVKTIRISSSDVSTILTDMDLSKDLSVITYYMPDKYATEEFPSRAKVVQIN